MEFPSRDPFKTRTVEYAQPSNSHSSPLYTDINVAVCVAVNVFRQFRNCASMAVEFVIVVADLRGIFSLQFLLLNIRVTAESV